MNCAPEEKSERIALGEMVSDLQALAHVATWDLGSYDVQPLAREISGRIMTELSVKYGVELTSRFYEAPEAPAESSGALERAAAPSPFPSLSLLPSPSAGSPQDAPCIDPLCEECPEVTEPLPENIRRVMESESTPDHVRDLMRDLAGVAGYEVKS